MNKKEYQDLQKYYSYFYKGGDGTSRKPKVDMDSGGHEVNLTTDPEYDIIIREKTND